MLLCGGLLMTQTEEATNGGRDYTCPNSSCGKIFERPLKVVNLQRSQQASYDACPSCLTEIPAEQPLHQASDLTEKNVSGIEQREEGKSESPQKPGSCQFHMGYLSERTSKEELPENCILCIEIVQCMLMKIKQ
jgi:hypothetical protein